MKIALVHDYLTQDGGAERVLRVLQEIYPEAPTFVLVHNKEKMNDFFKDKEIFTSFIQRLPFGINHYQWFLPFMPLAVERFNLSDFDLVLSSSSSFAKGIITKPEALHICYCHTPTRYLWTDTHSYIKELGYNPLIKKIIPHVLSQMRIWDKIAADRVDNFIANSKNVAQRIKKYYGKESDVIYPPVELEKFSISNTGPQKYFLTGGRLVAYKRYDLVVQAFNKLGIALKIFGQGPEEKNLRKMAKENIEFLGKVSDVERARLYQQAQAFIHPQVEDFGITAVESMASGRPVIAFKAGGALETVVDGLSGKFFDEQSWECLADTILRFESFQYNPEQIRAHAFVFDKEIFKEKIRKYVGEKRGV